MDESAFLTAVRDDPFAPDPRLVYADWLEERGDPRAEYLRLLCAPFDPQGAPAAAFERLRECRAALDPAWIERVRFPHDVPPDYGVIREVARGALTTLYEATCALAPGRRVIVRVLRNCRHAPYFLEASQLEARLEHPHIPSLYEVGEAEGGSQYSVRQFVDGDDLQNDIGSASRPHAEVARVIAQVSEALDYLHGRGAVHGYVHPRHLLLGRDGAAWLIGFGEYPPAYPAAVHPVHLAPEQLEAGGQVTPRADVYGLAETAFWLLCGRHPFGTFGDGEPLLTAKRQGQTRPIDRVMRQGLPDEVRAVLLRGLCPAPAERYDSAGAFARALTAAVRPKRWWRFW
jgi:serine/threonine-protein kinase